MPRFRLNDYSQTIKGIVYFFEILASIATVAGVIGLFIVYKQLKIQESEAAGNIQNQIYEKMVDIDKFFIEHPDARMYIYNDLPVGVNANIKCGEKDCAEPQVTAVAAAELMLDFFSQVFIALPSLEKIVLATSDNKVTTAADDWYEYVKDIYICSPTLRDRLNKKPRWYQNERVKQFIVASQKELDQRPILLAANDLVEMNRCDKVIKQ